MKIDNTDVERITLNWIESFVIDLNLCPFAKREIRANKLRLSVTNTRQIEDLITAIETEIQFLMSHPNTETSLLIHPNVLQDFITYNQFLAIVDESLVNLGMQGILQVASFHPDYQFADTDFYDPENYTNRSPYPMLHFLREASVTRAIDQHADSALIPQENIQRLKKLGNAQLRALFENCFSQV